MRIRSITIMVLAGVVAAAGAGEPSAGKPKTDTAQETTTPTAKAEPNKAAAAACMHCGSTCKLTPICICKPGKKKQPRNQFETSCEPICVAGCGSKPWPFSRTEAGLGCTGCCDGPGRCSGWVRQRKKLTNKTIDEEVPTIERRVASICQTCAGDGCAATCTACGCLAPSEHRAGGWWARFACWLEPW